MQARLVQASEEAELCREKCLNRELAAPTPLAKALFADRQNFSSGLGRAPELRRKARAVVGTRAYERVSWSMRRRRRSCLVCQRTPETNATIV